MRRWTEVPPWQRLERGLWERAGPQGSRTGTHSSSPAAVGLTLQRARQGALRPQSACCLPGACPKHPLQQSQTVHLPATTCPLHSFQATELPLMTVRRQAAWRRCA